MDLMITLSLRIFFFFGKTQVAKGFELQLSEGDEGKRNKIIRKEFELRQPWVVS